MDKLTKYDNLSLIYAAEAIPYLVDTEKKPEDPQTKSAAVSLATSPPTHPSSEHLEDAAGSAASGSPAAVAAAAPIAPIANQPHGLGTDDIESPALEPEPQNNCSNVMAFFSCICCCCGNQDPDADLHKRLLER